jgi:mono/diheme cytochrome c family protein
LSKRIGLLFAVWLSLTQPGCSEEEEPKPTSGAELFNTFCVACHGPEGRGKFLRGIPANILTRKSPAEISLLIRQGQKHQEATMPSFPQLTQEEADLITLYLFKLRDDFNKSDGKSGMLVAPPER